MRDWQIAFASFETRSFGPLLIRMRNVVDTSGMEMMTYPPVMAGLDPRLSGTVCA